MTWDADLICARCKHRADYHGIDSGCMVRHPAECDCPVTEGRIYDRAVRRMSAGLEFNTESDPDAEQRGRITPDLPTTERQS